MRRWCPLFDVWCPLPRVRWIQIHCPSYPLPRVRWVRIRCVFGWFLVPPPKRAPGLIPCSSTAHTRPGAAPARADDRVSFESEIVRKCLSRNEQLCSFIEYQVLCPVSHVCYLIQILMMGGELTAGQGNDPWFWRGETQASLFEVSCGHHLLVVIGHHVPVVISNSSSCQTHLHPDLPQSYKVVYRRYASLFFVVGVDADENELAVLEFIHMLVETLDKVSPAPLCV